MADNVGYTPGEGATVAADEIGGVLHQRVKIGIGADGTAVDLSSSNPMPITAPSALNVNVGNFPASQAVSVSNFPATQAVSISDPSTTTAFGPITTASTALFAYVDTANDQSIQVTITGSFVGSVVFQGSDDGSNWFNVQGTSYNSDVTTLDTLYAPDIISIPVISRYFRVVTSSDFSGSVSGYYALRVGTPPMPYAQSTIVGVDPSVVMPVGGFDPNGYPRRLSVSPGGGLVPADGTTITGSRLGTQVGPIVLVDTTGYNSVVVQLANVFTGTVTFQVSNDLSTWQSVAGWASAGGATPVTTATVAGVWIFPAAGRYFRAQLTTAGTGVVAAVVALKNFSAWMPLSTPSVTATNLSVNIAQVAGVATAGGISIAPISSTNGQTLNRLSQTVTTPAATQIKASAGRLTMLSINNASTVGGFLHLYNASTVTLGTTADVQCYAVPANVTNFDIKMPDGGLFFSAGIGAAFTAASTATDNTAFGSAPTLIANYAFI